MLKCLLGGAKDDNHTGENNKDDNSDISLNSEEEVCRVVEVPVNSGSKKRKYEEKKMVDKDANSTESEKPSKPKRSKFSFRPRNY